MNYIKLFFIMTLLSLVLVASEEQPTEQEVAKLYVATFNRAPDSGGLKYWTTDSGLKLSKISQSFFDQPETQSLYPPSTSNRDFIASVYQNLFNRKPETSGWDYWETQLNVGAFNKNRFIEAVINGAQGDDAVILENKTEVGIAFADAGLNNMDKAKEVMSGITANQESVTTALESISNNDSSTKKGLGLILDPPKVTETLYAATPPTLYASGDLPESYDLSKDMPPVRDQGGQGSCVSWAVGYYIKGYHEHIESGIEYGKGNDYTGVHSPAFLFNIVKISCSGGSSFSDNLERLRDIGISSWEDMPYNQYDCESLPSQEAIENAKCSKIVNYKWLPLSDPLESIQLEDIKYYLNQNKPILIGIPVYNRFYSPERYMEKIDGEYIYQKYNKNEKSDGNHAIVVVGYDNHKNAFKIVNSWGADWGNKGYLWIDYEVFKNICFVAYVTTDAKNSCDEGSAYLSINKASLVFGDKPINESYSEEFTISNTGTADVYISNITVPNGYSVNWTNETISAGMKKSVTVTFKPTEKKRYNGTLLVEHNAENGNDRVNLVGAGVDKDNPNQPPIANAGADVNANEDDLVQLDASGSSDLDGSIVSYQWKEGNTIIGNNKILQKSDFTEGVHRITLIVTDDDGVTSTDTVVVTINANNQSPIANAGDDITITVGDEVSLDASKSFDSDGTIRMYQWKRGSKVLSFEKIYKTSGFQVGRHYITLYVTDDDGAVSTDTMTLIVNDKVFVNKAPIANAGDDITITVGDEVSLDASKSFDSDGTIRMYQWKRGSKVLSFEKIYKTSGFQVGRHYITLYVTDDDGAVSTDTMTLIVNDKVFVNKAPVANAGEDKKAYASTIISLDGTKSSDDKKIVKYQWELISNGEVNLMNPTSSKASFVAKNISKETVLEFKLTVTDAEGLSNSDTIKVTLLYIQTNKAPTANAGDDITITVGDEVSLDASKSFDSDGTIKMYQWKRGSKVLSFEKTYKTSGFQVGRHYITLYVTDDDGAVSTDTMTLTVNTQKLIANNDQFEVGCSLSEISGNVLDNDVGILKTTSVKILKKPEYIKEFELNSDGTFNYKTSSPVLDGKTIDTFQYQISQSDDLDTATVTMIRNNKFGAKCIEDIQKPINPFSSSFLLKERESYKEVSFEISRNEFFNPNKIVEITPIVQSPLEISSYQWKEGSTILSQNKKFIKKDFLDGIHTVILVAKDKNSEKIFTVKITLNIKEDENKAPVADTGYPSILPDVGVRLNASGSSDSDGVIKSYKWKLGDKILSTEIEVTIKDLAIGSHTIFLEVTDDDGAVSTDSVVVTINQSQIFNLSQLNGIWNINEWYYSFGSLGEYSTYKYDNECYKKTDGYQFKQDNTYYKLYRDAILIGRYSTDIQINGNILTFTRVNSNGSHDLNSYLELYKSTKEIDVLESNLCL